MVTAKKATKKKKEEAPIEKFFSIKGDGSNWFFTILDVQGDKIVKKEEIGPNLRGITEEEFKMTCQRYFDTLGY